MHEHLRDLAAAVVRLHLGKADRAAVLDSRHDAHVGELGNLTGLGAERHGLDVLAEVLPMPYVAELTHRVVVHLDELAATLRRHTTAMHLLQSGVPFNVIALWLGHESTNTTHRYVEANLEMKEKALARLEAPDIKLKRFRASDDLMKFLQAL